MVDKKRRLVIKSFHIEDANFGEQNSIDNGTLTIDPSLLKKMEAQEDKINKISVDILNPGDFRKQVNTIMDIVPISTKVLGDLGQGITHTLTGVYVVLTGADVTGRQLNDFGSSDGILEEQIHFGRAGTPDRDDIIIHFDVLLNEIDCFNRELANIVYEKSDEFIQHIRNVLKKKNSRKATESHEFYDKVRKDAKKVVIVKQIAGQGALHDNRLFCNEPSGFKGGLSIIDMNNMPILLTPNEYRDGAIRAMT